VAIGVQLDFEGATTDQYDQVIAKMGFKPKGPGAPSLIFHWVTKTATGIRVIDVWETREQFETFAAEKIGPITQEVGVPGPPKTQLFDVHNYLTAG